MTIAVPKKNGRATKDTPKKVRVAAYARISVADREATQFSSIEAQVEAISAYIKSQGAAGWTLVGEPYIDDGYSGAKSDRPRSLAATEKPIATPAWRTQVACRWPSGRVAGHLIACGHDPIEPRSESGQGTSVDAFLVAVAPKGPDDREQHNGPDERREQVFKRDR